MLDDVNLGDRQLRRQQARKSVRREQCRSHNRSHQGDKTHRPVIRPGFPHLSRTAHRLDMVAQKRGRHVHLGVMEV